MPRFSTQLQSQFPYHVGARCINREWFHVPIDEVWEIMSEQLFFVHHAYNARILAFILMSNHFHLMIQTPDENLNEIMSWFMRETSRALTKSSKRINQAYGARYFRSILNSHHYYLHSYKYLYANSVQAGLVARVEDYPFSSLPGLLGIKPLYFTVAEDATLFADVEGTLSWLNRPVSEDHWGSVKKALRKKQFKLPKPNRSPHALENDPL